MAKGDGNDVCMYEITFSFLHIYIEHTRYTDRNIYICKNKRKCMVIKDYNYHNVYNV